MNLQLAGALAFCLAYTSCSLIGLKGSPPVASASCASVVPVPLPTILMLQPDAPPRIMLCQVSSTTPRAGDTLSSLVLTSSNVASVEMRVGTYGLPLNKTGVGRFEGSYSVPTLPLFAPHRFTLRVIARNTAGVATEQGVELQIR